MARKRFFSVTLLFLIALGIGVYIGYTRAKQNIEDDYNTLLSQIPEGNFYDYDIIGCKGRGQKGIYKIESGGFTLIDYSRDNHTKNTFRVSIFHPDTIQFYDNQEFTKGWQTGKMFESVINDLCSKPVHYDSEIYGPYDETLITSPRSPGMFTSLWALTLDKSGFETNSEFYKITNTGRFASQDGYTGSISIKSKKIFDNQLRLFRMVINYDKSVEFKLQDIYEAQEHHKLLLISAGMLIALIIAISGSVIYFNFVTGKTSNR